MRSNARLNRSQTAIRYAKVIASSLSVAREIAISDLSGSLRGCPWKVSLSLSTQA